jgi:hypothetical protein
LMSGVEAMGRIHTQLQAWAQVQAREGWARVARPLLVLVMPRDRDPYSASAQQRAALEAGADLVLPSLQHLR